MVRAEGTWTRGRYLHCRRDGRCDDRTADDCMAWGEVWMARGVLFYRHSRAGVALAVAAHVSPGTLCRARPCGVRAGSAVVALRADQSLRVAADVRQDVERPGLVF